MTRACRSGHEHVSDADVLLCQQDQIIDLLRGLTLMTEATGETIDQGFADLDAGQADLEAKLEALSAEEARELAFLADLEANRGTGQLAPEQQARLDDLKARQAAVSAALDAAREQLAEADGTVSPPAPAVEPLSIDGTGAVPEPVPADGTVTGDGTGTALPPMDEPAVSDTPIADAIPAPAEPAADDAAMTGGPVASVHDEAGEGPAPNEL